jgi:hypothetical protein
MNMKLINYLKPDKIYDSVEEIDLQELWEKGFRGILLDLDNTIAVRNSNFLQSQTKNWVSKAKEIGFRVCLISNNLEKRTSEIARELNVSYLARAGKPRKKAFLRALERISLSPEEALVIGDQLFTDILGGKRASLYCVLVKPKASNDLLHTKVLRLLERYFLSKVGLK